MTPGESHACETGHRETRAGAPRATAGRPGGRRSPHRTGRIPARSWKSVPVSSAPPSVASMGLKAGVCGFRPPSPISRLSTRAFGGAHYWRSWEATHDESSRGHVLPDDRTLEQTPCGRHRRAAPAWRGAGRSAARPGWSERSSSASRPPRPASPSTRPGSPRPPARPSRAAVRRRGGPPQRRARRRAALGVARAGRGRPR